MAKSLKQPETAEPMLREGVDGTSPQPCGDTFERDLTALMPFLRAFAQGLCGNPEFAEDFAQEALLKAWCARDSFERGTNLKAWLFTILRHEYYSHLRRAWRKTPWDDQLAEQIRAPAGEQFWAVTLSDCARAFEQLLKPQREAVLVVGAGGFTYDDAADLLGTRSGSLKSRTARGRSLLAEFLEGKKPLPPRSANITKKGIDDILAQLTNLSHAGAKPKPRTRESSARR